MVVLETKSNKLYHCNLINEKILSFMHLETDRRVKLVNNTLFILAEDK